MADKVQADYEQLGQVSSQFANQSQLVQELMQKVRSSMQQLEDGGWIGRGADAFFSEMQSVLFPGIQRLESALNDASSITKQIAQNMEQAEQDAQSLFSF
jgi:WXG100 family type VII secretion target